MPSRTMRQARITRRRSKMTVLAAATVALLSLGSLSTGAPPQYAPFGNFKYKADIHSPTDVDVFKATLMSGERIRAKIRRGEESSLLPLLDLENARGQSVGIDLHISKGRAKGRVAQFKWKKVSTSGTYSVIVQGNQGTSGNYDASFDVRPSVEKESGRGLLTAETPALVHRFEAVDGALLTLRAGWKRGDAKLRVVSITDPDGNDLTGFEPYTKERSRDVFIKKFPLSGRLGTYTLTLAQDGVDVAEQQPAPTPPAAPTSEPNTEPTTQPDPDTTPSGLGGNNGSSSGNGSVKKIGKTGNDARTRYRYTATIKSPRRPDVKKAKQLNSGEPTLETISEPIHVQSGTNVIIEGENFTAEDGVTVWIGDTEASVRSATPNIIEATVPEGEDGSTSPVIVKNSDEQAVMDPAYVVYAEEPQQAEPEPTPEPTPEPEEPVRVPTAPIDPTAFQWTEFTPSADTRIYYVSSSEGSDSNDGLSPERPLHSPQTAYSKLRDGYPDWMLLKRGDTWTANGRDDYSLVVGYAKSGRSESEPLLIGSYGESTARPRLINGQFRSIRGEMNHVALVGWHLERPIGSVVPSWGVDLHHTGTGFLIEDCYIDGYSTNILVSGRDGLPIEDLRIRGSVVVDAFSPTGGHAQGLIMGWVEESLVEGCVFDHNGWREDVEGADPTTFNHNIYINGINVRNVTMRNNITARASSHGASHPGGACYDNAFIDNAIGIHMKNRGAIHRNVFVGGRDTGANARGVAIWPSSSTQLSVTDNILCGEQNGTWGAGMVFGRDISNLTVTGNIIYNWASAGASIEFQGTIGGENTLSGNEIVSGSESARAVSMHPDMTPLGLTASQNTYDCAVPAFKWFLAYGRNLSSAAWADEFGEEGSSFGETRNYIDPSRDVASYHDSLGGTATIDAFLNEARLQSRANWRPAYTGAAVAQYIRAGFRLR